MKKIFLLLGITLACTLSSCYSNRVICGDITAKTPVVKVNSVWNHHFIYGLVPGPNTKIEAKNFVEDADNYVVKTHQSFANGFIACLTFGFYTPTTTTYYMPLKDLKKQE